MPKGSLTASSEGIQRARKALKRLNLTQTALVNERGIASWSTVNNFFNEKPIRRETFLEICEELNLDWQDIAIFPSEEEDTQELTPLEKPWQQLIVLGSLTEEMGIVLVKEETLNWGWHKSVLYEKSVRLGSHIQFEVNFETSGHLLLIQKNTSGEVWCVCPSCFAPQPQLDTGKTSLPQQGAPLTAFPIEGATGLEQILAVITREVPSLEWLPQGSDEPLQLTESHLTDLLGYVNNNEECRIVYTEYTIVS